MDNYNKSITIVIVELNQFYLKIFVVDTFVSVKRLKKKEKQHQFKQKQNKKRQIKNDASMKNGELPELNGRFYLELQFSNGKMESSAFNVK